MTTKMSNGLRAMMLATIIFAPVALAASPSDSDRASEQHTDRDTLLLLNAELAHSQIVDRDPAFISKVALENFRVLAPGGLIENKEQVIAGLAAWDALGLHDAGVISKRRRGAFEALCHLDVHEMPPRKIKSLREDARVSQAVI